MSDHDRGDLDDVLREERSRGRRPVDMGARRDRRRVERQLLEVIYDGPEADFLRLIRAYGIDRDSPRGAELRRLRRDVLAARQPPRPRR